MVTTRHYFNSLFSAMQTFQVIDMLQKDSANRPSAIELYTTRLPPLMIHEEDPAISQDDEPVDLTKTK